MRLEARVLHGLALGFCSTLHSRLVRIGYLRLCSVCCTSLVGALAVLHRPIAFQGWGDAGRLEEFVILLQRAVAQHK